MLRPLLIALLVVAASLASAASAGAARVKLAEGRSIEGAALDGDEAIFGERAGTLSRFFAVPETGGPTRPLAAQSRFPHPFGQDFIYDLHASGGYIALLQQGTEPSDGECGCSENLGTTLDAGAAGAPGELPRIGNCTDIDDSLGPFDLDGSRLATVQPLCHAFGRQGTIDVHDLAGGGTTRAVTEDALRAQIAGRFLAYETVATPQQIVVRDLDAGVEISRRDARGDLVDLQGDGKVLLSQTAAAEGPCPHAGRAVWFDAPDAAEHVLSTCGTPVRIAGDAVALRTPGGLAVEPLAGAPARNVLRTDGRDLIRTVDWNGRRLLYATAECDGRRVFWSDDTVGDAPFERVACPASLVTTRLRLTKRSVIVRVRCPQGCTGFISLTVRGRGVARGRILAARRGGVDVLRMTLHRGGLLALARAGGRAVVGLSVRNRAGVDRVTRTRVRIR